MLPQLVSLVVAWCFWAVWWGLSACAGPDESAEGPVCLIPLTATSSVLAKFEECVYDGLPVPRQRLQGLPSVRTHTDGRTQRPRPRARLGDSACSSPTTVYYDALESVQSEDEGSIPVCPGPHTKHIP